MPKPHEMYKYGAWRNWYFNSLEQQCYRMTITWDAENVKIRFSQYIITQQQHELVGCVFLLLLFFRNRRNFHHSHSNSRKEFKLNSFKYTIKTNSIMMTYSRTSWKEFTVTTSDSQDHMEKIKIKKSLLSIDIISRCTRGMKRAKTGTCCPSGSLFRADGIANHTTHTTDYRAHIFPAWRRGDMMACCTISLSSSSWSYIVRAREFTMLARTSNCHSRDRNRSASLPVQRQLIS